MRKPQDPSPLREWLAAFARSLTLTPQERILAAAILLSLLFGSIVLHYRRDYRIAHPAAASPTPRRTPSSSGGFSGD